MTIRDNLKSLKVLLDSIQPKESHSPVKDKRISGSSFSTSSKFKETMTEFHDVVKTTYEKLDSRFKEAESLYQSAVVFYGEDPKLTPPDEFFGVFWGFCCAFSKAKSENIEAIQRLNELKKREAERKVCF